MTSSQAINGHEGKRSAMIEDIAADFAATCRATGIARMSPAVQAAMMQVPRHRFVPAALQGSAWDNRPLPIGHDATISQPFIVALMTEVSAAGPGSVVLEVGTGCGYQAAVLAELGARVYSIELTAELSAGAQQRLQELGYGEVALRIGDGHLGWPEHSPYDAILVTAAARTIPRQLVRQLAKGGRMVVPVGAPHATQSLELVERDGQGGLHQRKVLDVAFVPLRGAGD